MLWKPFPWQQKWVTEMAGIDHWILLACYSRGKYDSPCWHLAPIWVYGHRMIAAGHGSTHLVPGNNDLCVFKGVCNIYFSNNFLLQELLKTGAIFFPPSLDCTTAQNFKNIQLAASFIMVISVTPPHYTAAVCIRSRGSFEKRRVMVMYCTSLQQTQIRKIVFGGISLNFNQQV